MEVKILGMVVVGAVILSSGLSGLNLMMRQVKEEAFASISPVLSLALLFLGIGALIAIVQTTSRISAGKPVSPWQAGKFLVLMLVVSNFDLFVLTPLDAVFSIAGEGLGSVWEIAKTDNSLANAYGERNPAASDFLRSVGDLWRGSDSLVNSESGLSTTEGMLDRVAADVERGQGPSMLDRLDRWTGLSGIWGWVKRIAGSGALLVDSMVGAVKDDRLLETMGDLAGSAVLSLITAAVSGIRILAGFCICIFSGLYLAVIGLVGPFVFAFSVVRGFENGVVGWFSRYIQVSFWYPLTQLIGSLSYIVHYVFISTGHSISFIPSLMESGIDFSYGSLVVLVSDICVIAMYFAIPSISKWIVQSSGADGVGGTAAGWASAAGHAVIHTMGV